MTETEFRVKHSEVIEYYQYIEMRLRFICSAIISDDLQEWFSRLGDYDADPMGKLIKTLRELQKEKNCEWLSPEDFESLDEIRKSRNYWSHECFIGLKQAHVAFNRKGLLKHSFHSKKIISDLQKAIEWDEKLTEISSKMI